MSMKRQNSRGNLQEIIGDLLIKLNGVVANPEGDSSQLHQELMLLDVYSYPITKHDNTFLGAWVQLAGERPKDAVWTTGERYEQMRLIIDSLYRNGVVAKLSTPFDDSFDWDSGSEETPS